MRLTSQSSRFRCTSLLYPNSNFDSINFLTEQIPGGGGGGIPLDLPRRHQSEIGSGFGEPDGILPQQIPRNTPRGENQRYFINWARLRQSS